MDKYEFNIKVEQIKKLVNKGDYETAMKIADTIDWRRVRSTSLLTMVAQVYERNEEYQDAKDILLLAFERAPLGKGLLFKLTDLALRGGDISEAEAYYREFCDLSADDPRQNLLRYLILETKGAPIEQLINSLERYSQEELDEKWLYKLAELYHEAGNADACVRICDKIMLMFGLGKYVDKAMELKLQHAPLTDYQMDLVENREKYEEKLRAVEQNYNGPKHRTEENFSEAEDEGYRDDGRNESYDESEAADGADFEEDMEEASEAEVNMEEEPEALEDNLIMKLHEEAAEKDLAKEMSKFEPFDEEESPEDETRVLHDIRSFQQIASRDYVGEEASASAVAQFESEEETIVEDWDLEPEEETKNHLMIEADDPQKGLNLALESLKKIHKELGSKNSVAKISGENLNRKSVLAVADRLAGKDLIIERAADLNAVTIMELNELMEQDNTGMLVVLIDTPARMERLHNNNSGLADKFQYIGCEQENLNNTTSEEDFERADQQEILKMQAEREAEAEKRRSARQEVSMHQAELEQEEKRSEEIRQQEELQKKRAEEEKLQMEYEAASAAKLQAEYEAANAAKLQAEYEAVSALKQQVERETEQAVRQVRYEEDRNYQKSYDSKNSADDSDERDMEPMPADGHEMDVEEFAQYACKYAAEIDCSISGKSMLALYERAEMMEEDGVLLTRESAEELIEEAADKAEKKSFGGMLSSKYDKDGLLILKEKHFFD